MLRSIAQQCVSEHMGLPHPSRRALSGAPQDEDVAFRSRDAIASELLSRTKRFLPQTDGRHFILPPSNKGGGAPNGAPPVPASERDAGAVIRDRSPFGAPPRLCAGIIHPNSAWAALPGIAGCKREDPLRRQCSRHPAVRSRAGRDDAQTACRQK